MHSLAATSLEISLASLLVAGVCTADGTATLRLFPCAALPCSYLTGEQGRNDVEVFRDVTLTDTTSGAEGGSELHVLGSDPTIVVSSELASPEPPVKTTSFLRKIRPFPTLFIMGTTIGYAWGNTQDEIPFHGTFHFTAEGFFGQNTYAGGADKASHLVDYAVAYRALEMTYRGIGYTDRQSQWLGFASALAAGLTTEIGDGTSIFGFSWEDFTMDFLGAFSAMTLARSGWDDTFGFRYGSVPSDPAPDCCIDNSNIGRDYSGEIYTADVKIAGLARRLKFNPGPARFLLFSMTYGTNGYNHASPEVRQRLVGLEIGIHFSEILRSLGVPKEPIWGELLYFFFDTIRLPYMAIGVRYDLNHHEWFAPTTGRTPFRVPPAH